MNVFKMIIIDIFNMVKQIVFTFGVVVGVVAVFASVNLLLIPDNPIAAYGVYVHSVAGLAIAVAYWFIPRAMVRESSWTLPMRYAHPLMALCVTLGLTVGIGVITFLSSGLTILTTSYLGKDVVFSEVWTKASVFEKTSLVSAIAMLSVFVIAPIALYIDSLVARVKKHREEK